MSRAGLQPTTSGSVSASWRRLPGVAALLACTLALPAQALDCPRVPEQSNKDWDVEVKAAVGKLGPVTGAELATRTRSVTSDLLGKLPQADRVYLEQMMYASYCSALRDNKALTEAEREARIRAYNTELRSTLREPPRGAATAPAAADPRDAARRELARIPLDYTAEAFVDSVVKRKEAAALLFLKAGIDPDSTDREGNTALMVASGNGDTVIVNALLKARASVDKRNPGGGTALGWAAVAGHVEVVRLLLTRGPDAQSVEDSFVDAAAMGRRDVTALLLERFAGNGKLLARALRGTAGSNFVVADENALVEVVRLLIQRGADVSAADDEGWTALMLAAERGRGAMARLLVDSGADINHRCACRGWLSGGYTALAMASNSGRPEIAEMLITAGADLSVRNNDGQTALFIAADRQHERIVASLLVRGADANAKDRKGNTPLMQGTQSTEIVRDLLAHGAAVNAKGENGVTPLMAAAARGHGESAKLLLAAGADINARSDFGRTPLMVAIRNGQYGVGRMLVESGARVGERDENDKTALAYAEEATKDDEQARLVALLRKAGAQ